MWPLHLLHITWHSVKGEAGGPEIPPHSNAAQLCCRAVAVHIMCHVTECVWKNPSDYCLGLKWLLTCAQWRRDSCDTGLTSVWCFLPRFYTLSLTLCSFILLFLPQQRINYLQLSDNYSNIDANAMFHIPEWFYFLNGGPKLNHYDVPWTKSKHLFCCIALIRSKKWYWDFNRVCLRCPPGTN